MKKIILIILIVCAALILIGSLLPEDPCDRDTRYLSPNEIMACLDK